MHKEANIVMGGGMTGRKMREDGISKKAKQHR